MKNGREKVPLDKLTGVRFVRAVRDFANSEVGWKAKLMFAALIALLFGINGMNVVNSCVGRDFMTAIAERHKAEFIRLAFLFIGVFAVSTLVTVISRFTAERLGLLWRGFLPRRHHPYRDGTAGIHAAPGRTRPPSQVTSHPLPRRARTQR